MHGVFKLQMALAAGEGVKQIRELTVWEFNAISCTCMMHNTCRVASAQHLDYHSTCNIHESKEHQDLLQQNFCRLRRRSTRLRAVCWAETMWEQKSPSCQVRKPRISQEFGLITPRSVSMPLVSMSTTFLAHIAAPPSKRCTEGLKGAQRIQRACHSQVISPTNAQDISLNPCLFSLIDVESDNAYVVFFFHV